jgi:chaperonin GroES
MTVRAEKAPKKESAAITPLGDRVLVHPTESRGTSKSGIIIPDTAKERPQEGRVVAVGPGRILDNGKRIAPEVQKGDTILYGRHTGTDVLVGSEKHLTLRETDIFAVLR